MMIKNIHTIIQYSNKLPRRNIRLSSNSYHQPPMERRFSAKSLWAQFSRKEFPPLIFTIITAEWDEEWKIWRKQRKSRVKYTWKWNCYCRNEINFLQSTFLYSQLGISKSWEKFFLLFLINDQLVSKKTQLSTASMWVWKMLSV